MPKRYRANAPRKWRRWKAHWVTTTVQTAELLGGKAHIQFTVRHTRREIYIGVKSAGITVPEQLILNKMKTLQDYVYTHMGKRTDVWIDRAPQ